MSLLDYYTQITVYAHHHEYDKLEPLLIAAVLAFPGRRELGDWRDRMRVGGEKSVWHIEKRAMEMGHRLVSNINIYYSNVELYHAMRLDYALENTTRKLEKMDRLWLKLKKQHFGLQEKRIDAKLPRAYWLGDTIL